MEGISILTNDAILHIFKHLDIENLIAFAYTCERFRQICINARAFRKADLSGLLLRTQRGAIRNFFGDKQMVQHIRELNLSNHRVFNWQMDDKLIEEFINSICPQLEALHVVDCGMSFQRLHHILKKAPKLTAFSWSLWDFTSEDIEFAVKSIESSDGICLKNIKHLHLEIIESKPQIHILKYLVLSHCKDLEELEISSWPLRVAYHTGWGFLHPLDLMILSISRASSSIEPLRHLHSLTVQAMGGSFPCSRAHHYLAYMTELSDFIFSVFRKKSRETNWKKLWISPAIGISRLQDLLHLTDSSVSLHEVYLSEFQSVEAITAHAGESPDAMEELKTFFQRIDDNTVRSLHLCQPLMSEANSILQLCEPISRVGGPALKFFSLSFNPPYGTDAVKNVVFHKLFSNCLNITELDLLGCCFEKDICEALSKLRHLTKVQLLECAVTGNSEYENRVEISMANLLIFVENCKNLTDFLVCGCRYNHEQFSCRLTGGNLVALAKLRKLKSLTLYKITGIREWAFMQNILENCNLMMLRISAMEHFNNPIFLVSAKFLKHLVISVPQLDLGSEGLWKLLSHAKHLERLCIQSNYKGSLNVSGAVEMFKSMPQLYVFHVHHLELENHKIFCDRIIRTIEEEESDRMSCSEFLVRGSKLEPETVYHKRLFPLNLMELCHMVPSNQ